MTADAVHPEGVQRLGDLAFLGVPAGRTAGRVAHAQGANDPTGHRDVQTDQRPPPGSVEAFGHRRPRHLGQQHDRNGPKKEKQRQEAAPPEEPVARPVHFLNQRHQSKMGWFQRLTESLRPHRTGPPPSNHRRDRVPTSGVARIAECATCTSMNGLGPSYCTSASLRASTCSRLSSNNDIRIGTEPRPDEVPFFQGDRRPDFELDGSVLRNPLGRNVFKNGVEPLARHRANADAASGECAHPGGSRFHSRRFDRGRSGPSCPPRWLWWCLR